MKKTIKIFFTGRHFSIGKVVSGIVFFFMASPIFAQTISYIIPDIGSTGRSTYIEIIGPYNQNSNFGTDGLYSNNTGDLVRVVCANNADTNKIKIGPVSVSWNGKLISTQVFVMPGLSPNSDNWQALSAAYRVPLQVVLNNTTFSNADTFYIVQPQPAIVASGAVNLGGGGLGGIRSRRGAMIVDDLLFNNGSNVTVSKTDSDPGTAGNQGFLPLNVISRGKVLIDNGASLSLNAPGGQNTDGGPGGGGGGTESFTNCSPCAGGTNHSGDGFTGGGTELLCGETPGGGSGSTPAACAPGFGGISLNGVPGGNGHNNCSADEGGGGGGTGHPFGTSGGKDGESGGYGGGAGYSGYGGGGYASDGTTPGTTEYGKANGNSQLIPFAGGSAGGAGVAGSGTTRGGGGGGGGAGTFHAYLSSTIISSGNISADGGTGVIGCGGYRGGGGGSGGAIILSGKLNSSGTGTLSVSGGAGGVGGGGSGGAGGQGRVRIDGPFTSIPTINPTPGVNSSSQYIGPSTDTASYVARSFTLTGTGNGQAIRIYLKPITKPWQLLTTISGYGTAWSQNIVLPCPDTLFLIATAQEIPSPGTSQYTTEPSWAFSQAATNILTVKNALKAHAGGDLSTCPASCNTIGGSPSATGGVPPYTYLWAPLSGLNDSLIANPTACLMTNSTYALTVTDSSGCYFIDSIKISMHPVPLAKFDFTNVCLNQASNFNDSSTVSSGSITNWSWDFGDGTPLNTLQHPAHTYVSPGTYTVSLIVTSNNGCKDTLSKNTTVHANPSVYFNALDVCDNNAVLFNNFSTILPTDTIQSYTWNFADSSPLNNNQNISHLYAASGSYAVKLIVVTNFGCSDSITKTVIVHPNPISNFNFIKVCHNNATQFTDTSTTSLGTISTWKWNLGDGSPVNTNQNPSHLYTGAGYHPVTLIVNNSFGCGDTITKAVEVYHNPVAGFTYNDVCFRDTMYFINTSSIDTSSSIANYLWVFGDASPTSNLQDPNHYYSSAGAYTVTLVTSTIDGCSNAATSSVKAFDPPISSFTLNNTCLLYPAAFTNTTISPVMGSTASWSWDFGDGSVLNTSVWSPAHQYVSPGNYHVTLTAYSSNLACPDTITDSITVFPMPVANFSFTNVCLNQVMNFNDLSTVSDGSISSRSWDFGDGTSPNGSPNPSHLYLNAGIFTVSLIVTTNNSCKDTITKTVVVHPLPDAQFGSINVCDGSVVPFNDLSTIATTDTIQSWAWDFGDGSPVINNQNTSHLYASKGSYIVQLVVVSNFGCTDSVSKTKFVNPNPVVNFTANDTIGCEPLCVNFQNSSSIATGANVAWLWSFGDNSPINNLENPMHCYSNDSIRTTLFYTPTFTVTSDSGCVSSLSENNYITVYPNPTANFTVEPKVASIVDPVISITDLSTGADFWNWNFGNQQASTVYNPAPQTYADTGTYIITLITSTQYNCIDTTTQTIIIEPDFIFYIPNAFTPNDDGINDAFTGKGIFINEFEMAIFDRWGNLIYKTDDINKPWDGRANQGKEAAQADVYVYAVKVTDFKLKKHTYKGIVTLVR